jgi:hypothetical protein
MNKIAKEAKELLILEFHKNELILGNRIVTSSYWTRLGKKHGREIRKIILNDGDYTSKKIVVCNYKNGMRHGEFKYYDDEILVKYDWYKDDEEFKNILHIC